MAGTVNFTVICPHCQRDLRGERIVDIHWASHWRTFFYTESNHQLVYRCMLYESVNCLEAEEERAGAA